jgi:hypothetical protein
MKNSRQQISPLVRGAFAETFGEQGHGQGVEADPFALGALSPQASRAPRIVSTITVGFLYTRGDDLKAQGAAR